MHKQVKINDKSERRFGVVTTPFQVQRDKKNKLSQKINKLNN